MSKAWIDAESWPALGNNEVQVWLAHLPSLRASLDELTVVLSPDEVARAARFRFPAHQERARMTRGLLRLLLGRHLPTDARKIVFTHNEHGKPALASPPGIHFNLSHSGDYAAFALTRLDVVGVDVERIREAMPQRDEIARRYFAASEQAELQAVGERDRSRAFFTLWTRKEAWLKATGEGIAESLAKIEVAFLPGEPPCIRAIAGDVAAGALWNLRALHPATGFVAALAIQPAAPGRMHGGSDALRVCCWRAVI